MRAALIPVKDLAHAKMRLADVLDREVRADLALAMLTDVVTTCLESGAFDRVAVVSSDRDVCWQARELGALAIAEPPGVRDLNDGVTFGRRSLVREGAGEVVVIPGDLPLLRTADIEALVAALGDHTPRAVIVAARDGGTNALALRPPEAIAPCFGRASAAAHIAAAQAAGLDVVELALDRFAFDVDSPDDLDALASLPVGGATAGWLEARAYYAGRTG